MRFNPKGLLVTGVGLFMLWAALQTRTSVMIADDVLLIAWMLLLVVSSVAIIRAKLEGRTVIGELGAFYEIRRWFSKP